MNRTFILFYALTDTSTKDFAKDLIEKITKKEHILHTN